MKSTGCAACDKLQAETGDKTALCPACEIGMLEAGIAADRHRIEELKAKSLFKRGDIVQTKKEKAALEKARIAYDKALMKWRDAGTALDAGDAKSKKKRRIAYNKAKEKALAAYTKARTEARIAHDKALWRAAYIAYNKAKEDAKSKKKRRIAKETK